MLDSAMAETAVKKICEGAVEKTIFSFLSRPSEMKTLRS
jgi:hypothetical protein